MTGQTRRRSIWLPFYLKFDPLTMTAVLKAKVHPSGCNQQNHLPIRQIPQSTCHVTTAHAHLSTCQLELCLPQNDGTAGTKPLELR